ncbi:MAG: DUF933 domain-containing protein [Phycisphaerae bacterium]
MRVAVVGFPFSGKTSVFSAISGLAPESTQPGDETLAAVRIYDERLDALEEMYKPKKRTEATMAFVDLPGSADGDLERAGLTKHLPSLRQCDALVLVVRAFDSPSVPAYKDKVDPKRDLSLLRDEILLADLEICSNRVEKLLASVKKPTKEQEKQKKELALLERCKEALENEKPLRDVIQPGEEEKLLRSFGFLTQKPIVIAINVNEEDAAKPAPFEDPDAAATVALSARVESDLAQMSAEERQEFMGDYGLEKLARTRIIQACFAALGMISFLTAGEEEVRAWPLPRDSTAVEAAGEIHSDLARGFIRAETVAFDDLVAAGSMRDAKAANKVRQEPKTYIVKDGDVILFKHSG